MSEIPCPACNGHHFDAKWERDCLADALAKARGDLEAEKAKVVVVVRTLQDVNDAVRAHIAVCPNAPHGEAAAAAVSSEQ